MSATTPTPATDGHPEVFEMVDDNLEVVDWHPETDAVGKELERLPWAACRATAAGMPEATVDGSGGHGSGGDAFGSFGAEPTPAAAASGGDFGGFFIDSSRAMERRLMCSLMASASTDATKRSRCVAPPGLKGVASQVLLLLGDDAGRVVRGPLVSVAKRRIRTADRLEARARRWTDLEQINLHGNCIRKIENLSGRLTKLSVLILCFNEIHKIEGLDDLPCLERLELGLRVGAARGPGTNLNTTNLQATPKAVGRKL